MVEKYPLPVKFRMATRRENPASSLWEKVAQTLEREPDPDQISPDQPEKREDGGAKSSKFRRQRFEQSSAQADPSAGRWQTRDFCA